ncbi:MAG: hypothetical protein ACRDI2_23240, partial [Chloroflexota bacterium]
VTVTRKTRTRNASGGFTSAETTHGPFTILLAERRSLVREVVPEAGTVRRDPGWLLLGGPEVDVQATTESTDTFTVERYGRFRVREVRPLESRGVLCGVQADLEREG